MSADLFVDVLRFPNLVRAADLNRIIPPLSLSTRTLLEFQIQHIFCENIFVVLIWNNLSLLPLYRIYHTYHADSHCGITWMGVLMLSSLYSNYTDCVLMVVSPFCTFCWLTVSVGCHSTGWGCDRVWAETVCQQLTLHSGTPSVGPTLASLSSVCGVPCPAWPGMLTTKDSY